MIRILLLLLLFCLGCTYKEKSEPLTVSPDNNPQWQVYEGRIPLDDKRTLAIELSIIEGTSANEGNYVLNEREETPSEDIPLPPAKGIYTATYNGDNETWVIHLQSSALLTGLKRIYQSKHSTLKEEMFRKDDMILQRHNENLLVVLDGENEPITLDPLFNLVRRTSRVFTVEGYFVYKGNTAEFFEMNTGEKWRVSKRGEFYDAARQYHQLAKEKFESLYLKGTAYSILEETEDGKQKEALVFKRIIQTSSSPVALE